MRVLHSRAIVLSIVAALSFALMGCQETVNFSVLRAARVNVKGIAGEGKDATVSLGRWGGSDGSAVEDVKQRIGELITNAEGGVVKFTTATGVVHVDGEVGEHAYHESTKSERSECSKYNEHTKKYEKYACTNYTRTGTARIRVSASVVDEAGKVVASDSYADKVDRSTSATDTEPPPIDGQEILQQMRTTAAAKLAALVIPHRVVVTKLWFKCGDANDTCRAGLIQLKSGNLSGAKDQFTAALDKLRAAPKQDVEAMAAAWWGIVLANEFNGDYPGARTALQEAIKLNPTQETYAAEGRSISAEEKNAKQLTKQGVGAD